MCEPLPQSEDIAFLDRAWANKDANVVTLILYRALLFEKNWGEALPRREVTSLPKHPRRKRRAITSVKGIGFWRQA
jgi:hypothetical protein